MRDDYDWFWNIAYLFGIALGLGFWATTIYVIAHFIIKYW